MGGGISVRFCNGIVLLLGVLTFVLVACDESDVAQTDTLRLVQVLFRHGDRAPTSTYPNDPNNNASAAWPEGMAQLTSVGKMQQFQLGKYLRQRYTGFLAKKYKSDELYVLSSDMDRTIMSLESNLAGLFPPIWKWHPNLNWQPIPLRTIPWKEDKYLHVNVRCAKYDKLYHEFIHESEVVTKINEDNKDFVKFLSEQAGVRATTVKDIIHIQDIILTEYIHNLSLPYWAMDALPRLNLLQAEVNSWSTYTKEMKRLRGGPLLDLLIKNMLANTGRLLANPEEKRIVVGGGNRKMLMFSAHDSTLTRIMNTMGIFHPHNPPYAAALMVELHYSSQDEDHFVKIFYRNDTTRPPFELELPGCGRHCSLSKMMELTNHLIPGDWAQECSINEYNNLFLSPENNGTNTGSVPFYFYPHPIYVITLAVSVVLTSLFIWCCSTKLNHMMGTGENGKFYYMRPSYESI